MVDRNVRDLYDKYRRHEISRRQFLERLAIVAGGVAAAYAMLPLLENNLAYGGVVAVDDCRLATEQVKYPGENGEIHGYLARPKDAARLPGVVVIHENRGLNSHIEDVARRIALAGFLAVAPDALSPLGGSPA
ncbi:MAG: hypothetical protein ACD_75C01429G0001, partial [uncultured bacterium]